MLNNVKYDSVQGAYSWQLQRLAVVQLLQRLYAGEAPAGFSRIREASYRGICELHNADAAQFASISFAANTSFSSGG